MDFLKNLFGAEVWKYLDGVPNIKDHTYQVSNRGNIRRYADGEWVYLTGTQQKSRTLVCLGKSTYNVGNLVLYAFGKTDSLRGPLTYADGNRHNNSLKNLALK